MILYEILLNAHFLKPSLFHQTIEYAYLRALQLKAYSQANELPKGSACHLKLWTAEVFYLSETAV